MVELKTSFTLADVAVDMIDSSPNLIFIVNAQTAEFVYVNPSVIEKWGYPRDELLAGGSPLKISPEKQPDGTPTNELAVNYMMKALDGADVDFRWVFRKADDEDFVGLCQIKAHGGSQQLAERGLIMCTVTDITQDEHNHQVLQMALRKAEAARIAQQTFIATMSHELRTPLNAINGFAGVLSMITQGKIKQQADIILRNGQRLLELINSVLDIARMESDQLPIVMKPYHIRGLATQTIESLQSLAHEKGVEIKMLFDEDVPEQVTLDKDAFIKVLNNLVGNALKFTHQGHIAAHFSRDGESLVIEVQDTGVGIPLHMQAAIFERFRQVDGSSSREYGGSGLGLYIVRSLCNMMGGTVTVSSTEGEGSTFTATMKVFKEEA